MSETARTALLRAAQDMAGRGWFVFPLHPGTKIARWHKKTRCPGTGRCSGGHVTPEDLATTDPDRIAWCWRETPWNVGVFPGPSGTFIVDCDQPKPGTPDPDGWIQLRELAAARGGPLPDTYTVTTPSGGRQLWYTAPPGCVLRGTVKHLASNVDTRGWGTYGLAPGSVLDYGAYELFDDTDPAQLPGWLVELNCERASTAVSERHEKPVAAVTPYVAAAVRRECERVAATEYGRGRNKALSTAAYALGQLVGAKVLDLGHARAELLTAIGRWTNPPAASKDPDVIETSLAAGMDNPRRITGKDAA